VRLSGRFMIELADLSAPRCLALSKSVWSCRFRWAGHTALIRTPVPDSE
jgi:hypothetical protein